MTPAHKTRRRSISRRGRRAIALRAFLSNPERDTITFAIVDATIRALERRGLIQTNGGAR